MTSDVNQLRNRIDGMSRSSAHQALEPEMRRRLDDLERFHTLLNRANEGIFMVRLSDWTLFDVNQTASRMAGAGSEQLLNRPLSDILPARDLARAQASPWFARPEGGTFTTQLTALDGSLLPVEVAFSSATFQEEAFGILVLRDISERLRAEEEKLRLCEQLRRAQKAEELGVMAGEAAHDFNNILTDITGYAALLTMQAPEDSPLREWAKRILAAVERGAELTRSLLTCGRRDLSQLEVLDLNLFLREQADFLQRIIGADVRLVLELGEGPFYVRGGKGSLDQLLLNLVVNAREAISGGGTVVVQTRLAAGASEVPLAEGEGGERVELLVCDSGEGMGPELLERIFTPFFTTKEPGQGTGLGLAIVQGILTTLDSTLRVASTPGEGTTFCIALPRAQGAPAPAASPPTPEEDLLPPSRTDSSPVILLVDDDPAVQEVNKLILQALGYRVLAVSASAEALETYQAWGRRIELVLSDVVLPEMNGWELTCRLRELDPQVKVLLVSGYSEAILQRKGIFLGPVELIRKPFSPAYLQKKLQILLGRND